MYARVAGHVGEPHARELTERLLGFCDERLVRLGLPALRENADRVARVGADLDVGTADAGACGGGPCGEATAIAMAGMGDGYESLVCVVRHDGEVWCWGTDPLGDGIEHAACPSAQACSPIPVRVVADGVPSGTHATLGPVASLAGGEEAMCALMRDGGVRCWGEIGNGQLPIADAGEHHIARRGVDATGVPLSGIDAIASGHYAGFAHRGTSWLAWGEGHLGSLADAVDTTHGAIVSAALEGATAISAGWAFGCGLWPPNAVRCWGLNDHAQLGRMPFGVDPSDGSRRHDAVPAPVSLPGVPTTVSAALDSACVLIAGRAWCWGSDLRGALGTFQTSSAMCTCEVMPAEVDLPASVLLVDLASSSVADRHCGRSTQGLVYCWGESSLGGAGSVANVIAPETPVEIAAGVALHADRLAVGAGTSCAIDPSGEVWCWGTNRGGALAMPPDTVAHPMATRVVFP